MKKFIQIILFVAFMSGASQLNAQCTPSFGNHVFNNPFHEPGSAERFFGYMCMNHDSLIADTSLGNWQFADGDGYGVNLISGSQITVSILNCSDNISITMNDTVGCTNTIINGAYAAASLNNTLNFTAPYTGRFRVVLNLDGVCGTNGFTNLGDVLIVLNNAGSVNCPASPANDLICNAIAMTTNVTEFGNTSTASLYDPMDSAAVADGYACSTPNNTLWYTYTPSASGNYLMNTSSPLTCGLNMRIGLFTAISCNAGGFTSGSCINGAAQGATASSLITLTGGTTYYLMVDGSQSSTGPFDITIVTAPPTPANDTICGATVLVLDVPVDDDNTDANQADPRDNDVIAAGYTCSPPGYTLWYKFTPSISCWYQVVISSPSLVGLHSWLGVFEATSCTAPFIAGHCDTGCVTGGTKINYEQMNAGTTYYIMTDGYIGDVGPYTLVIHAVPLSVQDLTIDNSISVSPNPANDVMMVNLNGLANQAIKLQVINAIGQLVTEYNLPAGFSSKQTISTLGLSEGLYFLRATGSNFSAETKFTVLH